MSEVVVDADSSIWLELVVDPHLDLDEWALRSTRTCFAEAALHPDERQVTLLATALLSLATWAQDAGGLSFAHLRFPELGPRGLALLRAYDAGDGSEAALRALAQADAIELVEPATVERLDTPLGAALRVRRYALSQDPMHPRGTLLASLSYVWHLAEHDTDLLLIAADVDLADLAVLEPDLDDLARAVRVEP